jgi:hypothetical protein
MSLEPAEGLLMNDTSKREQEIAIAYQSGMEDGARLTRTWRTQR